MKTNYSIDVLAPSKTWVCPPSDEDDSDKLLTTTDPDLALYFLDFAEARRLVKSLQKKFPTHSFRVGLFCGVLTRR